MREKDTQRRLLRQKNASAGRAPDGADRPGDESRPAFEESGRLLGARDSNGNVSERKQVDSERFRQTLDSMMEGCMVIGLDWTYLYVNDVAARQALQKRENLIGRTMPEMYPGVEQSDVFARYRRTMQERINQRFEQFYTFADGTTKWYSFSVEPVPEGIFVLTLETTEQKKAELALRQARDTLEARVAERTRELDDANARLSSELAERRLAEQSLEHAREELEAIAGELRLQNEELADTQATLQASEERLNRAQEIAHLGSWELDLVKNVLTWSDEVYRIFGLQPQEFGATYEAFLSHIHPDDRAAVDAAYADSVREGRDSYEIEHRVVRKATGEVRFVQERCRHTRDEQGKVIRSVGMVLDISDRKQAEAETRRRVEELRAANDELVRFNRLAVDRELRMVELKKEVNDLLRKVGQPAKYGAETKN